MAKINEQLFLETLLMMISCNSKNTALLKRDRKTKKKKNRERNTRFGGKGK